MHAHNLTLSLFCILGRLPSAAVWAKEGLCALTSPQPYVGTHCARWGPFHQGDPEECAYIWIAFSYSPPSPAIIRIAHVILQGPSSISPGMLSGVWQVHLSRIVLVNSTLLFDFYKQVCSKRKREQSERKKRRRGKRWEEKEEVGGGGRGNAGRCFGSVMNFVPFSMYAFPSLTHTHTHTYPHLAYPPIHLHSSYSATKWRPILVLLLQAMQL